MPHFRTAHASLLLLLGGAGALPAQTSLTIYNDGRVLARRALPVAVPKGTSTQRLALGRLEPGSLVALDPDVQLVRSEYDGDATPERALRGLVGRTVNVERPRPNGGYETITVTVLGTDPLRFRMPDGTVAFESPGGALRFPADAVTDPGVTAVLQAAAAKKELRVGYFTDGAAWRAAYAVVLGAKDARVTGSAVVESGTLAAQDAEVQLLAGAVSRAMPAPAPPMPYAKGRAMEMAADMASSVGEQRAGEFHLYTLPGKVTLRPGATTTVALFDPATAPYERRYVVRGTMPLWGFVPQQPDEMPTPVEVSYLLKRPRASAFGDRPMPGGVARVYQADAEGRLQLVGEASVRHTAAGEDVTLEAGEAFDLSAKRVQLDYATQQERTKNVVRTIATMTWKVSLANATDSAVTVDVREERGGEWSVVSSSVPAERVSAQVTRFRVAVPARGSAEVTYHLRVVW
jgi:hypothetical protein